MEERAFRGFSGRGRNWRKTGEVVCFASVSLRDGMRWGVGYASLEEVVVVQHAGRVRVTS